MKKRIAQFIGASALVSGLIVAGVAAPAIGAEQAPLASTGSVAAPATSTDPAVDRLNDLKRTQSQAEILKIVNSGKPLQALYDIKTKKYLAAYLEEVPIFSPFLAQTGPGCAIGDACATGTYSYGYHGTGSLSVSISGIKKVYAGTNPTTWWAGGSGLFTAAGTTLNIASSSFNKITRS